MSLMSGSRAAMILAGMFATAAIAQSQQSDVLILEVDDLADGDTIEAQVLETNYDERTLTVQFMSDNEIAQLVVPENAELVQKGPNNLADREMEFSDLHSGTRIELEGVEVEGAIRLRIVGIE